MCFYRSKENKHKTTGNNKIRCFKVMFEVVKNWVHPFRSSSPYEIYGVNDIMLPKQDILTELLDEYTLIGAGVIHSFSTFERAFYSGFYRNFNTTIVECEIPENTDYWEDKENGLYISTKLVVKKIYTEREILNLTNVIYHN